MIRQLRTWLRESGIFEPFNPPAHHHLSPKRPADWATRMTLAQALRALGLASTKAAHALLRMGYAISQQPFVRGGLVMGKLHKTKVFKVLHEFNALPKIHPPLRRRFTRGLGGMMIDVTRHDGS